MMTNGVPSQTATSSPEEIIYAPQHSQRSGRAAIGAVAAAIVLLVLLVLVYLDFQSDHIQRHRSLVILAGCLLIVACLAVLLARLGREYEKTAFELSDRNRQLAEENAGRRQMEEQLRAGEQMFRHLAEDSLDVVCRHAPDGTFTYVSPVAKALLGRDPQDMLGHSPLDFWQPNAEMAARIPNGNASQGITFAGYLNAAGNEPLLLAYSHPKGSHLWLEVVGHPLREAETAYILGWQTRVRDVSRRVREEERRQQVTQGLQAIAEATDELIAISDETELLRRAIDLGREKLGLERCRLFLTTSDGASLHATFGTSADGMTCDERKAPVAVAIPWQSDAYVPTVAERWRMLESVPLWYWQDGWQTLRDGWLAATLVIAGKEPLGVFYHDAAFSGAAYDPAQQQLVSVYCSLLGALIGRERTAATLLESQRHLQTVMQNAPLLLYAVDKDERFTLAMGQALSVIGFDKEKMVGHFLEEIMRSDHSAIERIRHVLSGETTYETFQYAGRHLQVLRQPSFDSEGKLSGMVAVGVDITDRVEAEQSLQASQDRYRRVVNSLKEVVFQTDAQGHWTFLNPSWTEILEWGLEASLGQSISKFIYPGDHSIFEQGYTSLITGRQDFVRHTLRYLTQSGDVRWIEVFARLMTDENGIVLGTTGTLNDVTERYRAETQLRATTALQNAILSGVNYAIIAIDKGGKVQLFNRAAETMLGYSAEEILNMDGGQFSQYIHDPHEIAHYARSLSQEFGEVIAPDGVALVYKAVRGVTDENDWTFIRRDNTRFPGRLSLAPLRDTQGEVTGLVGIIYDLTETKRVEHLKNEFVSVVSHELRTPLTSIRGSLGLLEGGVAGELPPAAARMIGIAQKNAERLVVLINDILDIEKIESGKMRFEMSELSLQDLLVTAAEQNRAYGETLGVRLELKILPPELKKRRVHGDEGRLMQVFSNLLSNAMKFTPAQGKVTLLAERRDNDWVRIQVHDEGPGVPEKFVPQLFERFAQAEEASTRKQGGTGLGLAIARAIIEKHEGHIGYLAPDPSKTGQGATFYLDLELLPASNVPSAPRVLVCEDDPEIAQLLLILLESEGYEVEVTPTLAEARQRLATETEFHALLLDLLLPDGNGLDLVAELHAATTRRNLPVIVVSAHCEAGKLCGDAFGVSDWITKPIEAARILNAVAQLGQNGQHTGKPRLLHVEDDADVRQIIGLLLGERAEIVAAPTLAEARGQLASGHFDLVLLDIGLPDGSGLSLVPLLTAQEPPVPVVLFSARDEAENQSDVQAALIKSRTSNAELRAAIERLLPRTLHEHS